MKKYISLGACTLVCLLQAACNSGSDGTTPAPNSITGTSTSINGNWSGGTSDIKNITINGTGSGLSAVNADGVIWQATYIANQNLTWESLPILPDSAAASTTATSSTVGGLYAGSTSGAVYFYSNSTWVAQSTTQDSPPTSMAIPTGNGIYLGNQAGNLWYYNGSSWSHNLSNGGFEPSSGGITQIVLDSLVTPQYLGVATGPYVWACQLATNGTCSDWENLVQTAINKGLYTDQGSTINAIGFYQDLQNAQDYGYIGNSYGNVWRAIYQTSSGDVTIVDEMTNNPNYPGFPSNAGQITSLVADAYNNLYVGTANGQVMIWTPATNAWSTITPSGSSSSVTALSVLSSTTTNGVLFVGNSSGQMWSISWQ